MFSLFSKITLPLVCVSIIVFGHNVNCSTSNEASMTETLYDGFGTRYILTQKNPGKYNWLFFPGGPGADSSYFIPLIHNLKLPGNVWRIDFQGNGSNIKNGQNKYDFDQWLKHFISAVTKFDNPVYVGHSFGGLLPLLFPELEDVLKGLIIIGSSPIIDFTEAKALRAAKGIIIPPEPGHEFIKSPTTETFRLSLLANAPCHFPPTSLVEGRKLFEDLPFNFYAQLWAVGKIDYLNTHATWVPERIPVLILGGSEDCVNPISLFLDDSRFKRNNITIKVIEGAGHFPWFEKMEAITAAINFYKKNNL